MRRATAGMLLVVTALIVLLSVAGGNPRAHSEDPVEQAREHLRDNAARYGLRADLADLTVLDVKESPGGQHVWFQQTVDGVPVEGAAINVSLPRADTRLQPFVMSGYVPKLSPLPLTAPLVSSDAAIGAAKRAVSPGAMTLRGEVHAEQVYFGLASGYVLSWRVLIPAVQPFGSWLVHVRADNGELLSKRDLIQHDDGRVFYPNPLQESVCNLIGSCPTVFHCQTQENADTLTGDYEQGTTQGWSFVKQFLGIQAGQNKLVGQYANATAFGGGLADEAGHLYRYPCNDGKFEEAMVYYHVDSAQRKIQALGFNNILNQSFPADAREPAEQCDAYYDAAPANWGIHMGVSNGTCPDEGEDGDGIIHEYGHAVQDNQVPGTGFGLGLQSNSMGEGFADYLAAAMFASPCLFEWTNGNKSACNNGTSPGLRNLMNTVAWTAPNGPAVNLPPWCVGTNDEHCVGLLWGGALWDIATAIGSRDITLQIALQSHFLLSNNDPTFVQGKDAICRADQLLYYGQHIPAISGVFTARGIGACPTQLPVGGVIEPPDLAALPLDTAESGQQDYTPYIGGAAAAAALLAVALAGWYVRRRRRS